MSPEMFSMDAKNYCLSDVFSLGLVFLYIYKDYSIQYEERKKITSNEYIQKLHS